MALAAEESSRSILTTNGRSSLPRFLLVAALMATAGNCFLKYLWWTACYSAWRGIPKLAEQWKAAGSRASLDGWSLLLLEAASVAVLCSVIRLRYGVRLVASLAITIAGTALFAWALSWIKQGIQ